MKIISRKEAKSLGLTHYFTGKPCKRGHISKRWSCSGTCIACHYEANPLQNTPRPTKEEKREKAKARAKRWYAKNKQKTINRAREWKRKNADRVRMSEKKWRQKETSKAICFMRDSLRRVLKTEKNGRTEKILGYTRFDLINHIERQFQPGMSWGNHGDWHIDHITPISAMLSMGITCPQKINCLSNLMPVWKEDNLKKNCKIKVLL